MTNPQPDGSFVIDVELSISQATFLCRGCSQVYYTGDLDLFQLS